MNGPKIIFRDETEANSYDCNFQDRRTKSAPQEKAQNHIHQMLSVSHQLDLSDKHMKDIPHILYEYKNLTVLYMANNLLRILPEQFFPSLPSLKWLDVRKNFLTTLPKTIANHENLEVLLLQENRISELPLELGLVPKLRGVQLLGNPITFPPPDVLNKGVQSMLQFLREEWNIQYSSDIRPIGEPFYTKPALKGAKPLNIIKKMKSQYNRAQSVPQKLVRSHQRQTEKDLPELSIVQCRPHTPPPRPLLGAVAQELRNLREEMLCTRGAKDCPRLKIVPSHSQYVLDTKSAEPHAPNKKKLRSKQNSVDSSKRISGEMKIYENLLKELWIARIKEMMERQSLIIQKRKDEETLKAWRKNMARLKEMTNPEDLKHDFIVPYDVDEDNMTMLSRWELHHPSMRTGRSKTGKRVPCKSVAEEMAEVLAALQKLHEKRFNKPSSPRSEQKALSMEIETLANLQKRLQAIKFRTAKDDMVFSLEKLKSEKFKPIIVKGIKTTSDIS